MKAIIGTANQWKKFKELDRSLKLFILVTISFGLFYSIRSLFFNFFILSLGFEKDFLGLANSMTPAATMILGLPMGMLTDRIGRKNASILGLLIQVLGYTIMLLTRSGSLILFALFIAGSGEALFFVSRSPLLTRLSDKQNRNFVFSLDFGLSTLAGVLGNFLAGSMPNWFESLLNLASESTASYQAVLFVSIALVLLAIIPAVLIKPGRKSERLAADTNGKLKSGLLYNLQNIMQKSPVWKLIIPNLLIGFGAALLIPYFNIFFVETFRINNQTLGNLFSSAFLFTGLSVLASPWLAGRLGSRIRAIVTAQAASLLFLITIGFSPWLGLAMVGYVGRAALMNMAVPLLTAFSMEQVNEDEQGTLSSLLTLSWQIGWTLMPLVSGLIQERFGFTPIFLITSVLYGSGTSLIWIFFKNSEQSPQTQPVPQIS
jgi:MFS family permease